MNRSHARSFVALLIAGSFASTVTAAKGITVKLTVSGPGLEKPVEVTSRKAVSANVWGGEFIGQPATEPPKLLPRYTVAFHVSLPRAPEIKVMYVVYYARDPFSGKGFIYLPARGEEWGRLNSSTIGRDGQDGRWHRAAQAWSDAVAASLP